MELNEKMAPDLSKDAVPAKQKITVDLLKNNASVLYWKIYRHALRQYMAWAMAGVAMILFGSNYTVGWNASESLPYHLFVVHKGEKAHKGELVAFPWDGGGKYAWMSPFKPGSTMVKYVLGVPGDVVFMDKDKTLFVNGSVHAKAKDFTKTGKPLTPILAPDSSLTIPDHKYYVGTTHKDSMDSRYDMVNLVDGDVFIGKVYAIF